MTNDELLIDVLRAAGHADAAELASKVLAHGQATKPAAAPAPPVPPANEDPVRREGLMILRAMRSQGILPAAEPIDGEAA